MGARANSATSAKMQFARRKAWKSVWSVASQPSSGMLVRGGVGDRTNGLLLIVTVGGREVAGGDDDRAETWPSWLSA